VKKQPPIFLRRPSPGRRRLRIALVLGAVAVLPPVVPHLLALRYPMPPARPVDAVMVATGGEGRIPEGYQTWSAGSARELCILGVGRTVPLAKLLPQSAGLSPEALARVHVEGWSQNTLENAFSAKAAAEERGYSSVILVTSDYHVPRAWITFRKVLPPRIALYVLPVRSERWGSPVDVWRAARRYFLEGWKYWGYRVLLRWE